MHDVTHPDDQQPFSWASALEDGSLTVTQMETLEAAVDSGQADSLVEAARLLDFEATHLAGGEPGPTAY